MNFAQKVGHFSSPGGKMRLLLHAPNLIKLYWRVFTDRRVSMLPKAMLVLGVLYFVIPIDFIPDSIWGLGQIDDLVVLVFALNAFMTLAPRTVVEEHVRLIDGGM